MHAQFRVGSGVFSAISSESERTSGRVIKAPSIYKRETTTAKM